MAVFLSPVGGAGAQFCDNNGNPLNGGKLYTYAAGTTTPAATYTSSAGNTAHTNPIILNAGGRVPDSGEIWLTDSVAYKFVLKTSADVLIATWDNIAGINSNFVNFTAQEEVQTATAGQTVFTLADITYIPGSNNLQVFVDGVNQIVDDSYLETNSTTVTFVSGLHVGALVKFTTAVSNSSGIETDAALVTYDPPFTGSESTTVEAKLAQYVSVFDFMTAAEIAAVKAGGSFASLPDVTSAIQSAISASQAVYFPAGQYKITSPINWSNQWLFGAVDNGELSTSAIQTMILADGTHPAFQYYNAGGFNSQGGGIRNFNIIFADGAVPTSPLERPDAIGFYVASTGGYPAFHTIENITVRGAMWAVFDQSGSWMGQFKQINSQHNYAGIYKNGGTTHNFENCYHRGGQAGFHVYNCLGVVFDACAVDLTETDVAGYYPIYIENSQVSFIGCDFEGIVVNANQTQAVLADGDQTLVRFESCIFLGSSVTAATETYLIHATNGAKISLSGVDFTPTNYTGSTGLFAYLVATAYGTIVAENVLLPALDGGTPTTAYATLPTGAGSSITVNDCVSPYAFYARTLWVQKAIKYSVTHDFANIAAGAYDSAAFTVTGALAGDLAFADINVGNTSGLVISAHVSAANTVIVTVINLRATGVDLPPAQIDIRVISQ